MMKNRDELFKVVVDNYKNSNTEYEEFVPAEYYRAQLRIIQKKKFSEKKDKR